MKLDRNGRRPTALRAWRTHALTKRRMRARPRVREPHAAAAPASRDQQVCGRSASARGVAPMQCSSMDSDEVESHG
eukprot:2205973-Prymnesium_polylepis.1